MALVEKFSDSFTYANGSLYTQASWQQHNTSATPGWNVNTNQVEYTLVSARDTAQVAGVTFSNDQYAAVDVFFGINGSTSLNAGLGLRIQPQGTTQNMYRVTLEVGSTNSLAKVVVGKYVSGIYNILATSLGEFASANGDQLNLAAHIVGDVITVYVNGNQIDFNTGTSVSAGGNFPSGVVGLDAFNRGTNNIRYDNFSAGDITNGITVTDPIIPGTSTTFSTSGNESPWTGARITDSAGNIKAITLVSQTSVSAPALGSQSYCLFGDVTLEVYNATESATATVAFNPPASHQYLVTLGANPENLTNTGYLFNWNPDNGYDGGQVLATVPIDAHGNILETDVVGEQTFYGIDPADGAMQAFPVTLSEGGKVIPSPEPYPPITETERLRINRIAIATKLSVLGDWIALMQQRLGVIDKEIDELIG